MAGNGSATSETRLWTQGTFLRRCILCLHVLPKTNVKEKCVCRQSNVKFAESSQCKLVVCENDDTGMGDRDVAAARPAGAEWTMSSPGHREENEWRRAASAAYVTCFSSYKILEGRGETKRR